MIPDNSILPNDLSLLKKEIISLSEKDKRNKQEIKILKEQIRYLQDKLFGRKSEKIVNGSGFQQMLLFDEPVETPQVPDDEVEVPAHKRKNRGRKPLPDNLPRVDVIHDLTDQEKICACGCEKSRIGQEESEQLDIIPAKMQVIRHIRYKYVCKNCEGVEADEGAVSIAPMPEQIIPKSFATPGLLSYILTAKFVDALPFYRQEQQFRRLGVELCRATMCNWAVKVTDRCMPLLELLHSEILSGPLINIDETTLKVLKGNKKKNRSKSYMWIFRGGPPDKPSLVYKYNESRAGDMAVSYLRGYKGYIQTDGYKGYEIFDRKDGIHLIGCWAHARRKFVDVIKVAGKNRKKGAADEAIEFIKELYRIERYARNHELSYEELYKIRQEQSAPILKEFKKWLDKKSVEAPSQSLLGKAIFYARNQWQYLERYIDQGYLKPDNNAAENAIRPFVLGRKNWLFSATTEGAHASAAMYSLVETAKANQIEPYAYLRFLFERIHLAKTTEDYKNLLPQYLDRKLLVTTP